MTSPGTSVERFYTSAGGRVYRIPLEVFPGFWGSAHLALVDGYVVLIDTGSGFGDSNAHLEAGMARVRSEFSEDVGWSDLTHVLITHGHIDHFGGLPYVRARSEAQVGVHELDLRVLSRFEERLLIIARRLKEYLQEAGSEPEERERLLNLYLLNKHLFSSVQVDFTFEAAGMQVGPFELLHVPGHAPGHVVIRLHDLLFSGDHVLKGISPHQAPERLSLNTGLGHYLTSLDRLFPWAEGVHLTLGGHDLPINDLRARVEEIRQLHARRLAQVLDLLGEAHTIAEVSRMLFPGAQGYHELLAIEEAGAHVEYLAGRGHLEIANLSELESDLPVALRYRRVEPGPALSLGGPAARPIDKGAGRGIRRPMPS